jgi:hypothetical protein
MSKLLRVASVLAVLAVPVVAVCALPPAGTTRTADPAEGTVTGQANAKKPARPAVRAGEPAEVLAEEWVATGGGSGGSGSPKDKQK